MKGLLDRIEFEFQVNWHSNGQWLLYAEGWQIAHAHGGRPDLLRPVRQPRRAGDPGLPPGSQLRRPLRHQRRDDRLRARRHRRAGVDARAVGGLPDCGFVFPDDDALVQEEFERNLPFALSVAKSAQDPDDPESVLGIETKPFYTKSDDPYKAASRASNFEFAYSYGDPQPVQVLAKRSLGAVTLKYRINGGAVQSAPTSEWARRRALQAGRRLLPRDARRGDAARARATRSRSGSRAAVSGSDSFTYRAVSETGRRVLVVAAEDYTGASPVQTPGPNYLSYYLNALAGQRGHGRRLRRRRPRPHRAGPPRRAGPLRRRDLVHGRRQRHPQARAGPPGTPTASRWTRSSSSGRT